MKEKEEKEERKTRKRKKEEKGEEEWWGNRRKRGRKEYCVTDLIVVNKSGVHIGDVNISITPVEGNVVAQTVVSTEVWHTTINNN